MKPVPDNQDSSRPLRTQSGEHGLAPENIVMIVRVGVRMLILIVFAGLGSMGFARTFEALLAMATVYCATRASMRRERPFDPTFTHFDEAAVYALCALVVARVG